jgi:steroid delta-isomerase
MIAPMQTEETSRPQEKTRDLIKPLISRHTVKDYSSIQTVGTANLEGHISKIIDCYENLSLGSVERLGEIYAPTIHFKDPFAEIFNLDELKRYFTHMFMRGRNPKFQITASVGSGNRWSLYWVFRYERFRMNWEIRGSFLLELDAQGRIATHEDYWDVSTQIYERIPLVGILFRAIKWGLATLM